MTVLFVGTSDVIFYLQLEDFRKHYTPHPANASWVMSSARAVSTLTLSAASVSTPGAKKAPGWFVYVVETKSGKLYTGVTVDVKRRLEQHQGIRAGGAKALRGDPPVKLRYAETAADRSKATKRESEIKRMPRCKKLELVEGVVNGDGVHVKPNVAPKNVVAKPELNQVDPTRNDEH